MRVAIYSRVSTKEQEPENQLKQLREYCHRMQYEIQAEYIEKVSGAESNRPKLKEMLKDASQRQFDILLVWSLDRLTREGIKAAIDYLHTLTGYGIGFKSYSEPFFDTTGSEMMRNIFVGIIAEFAKFERQRNIERVKAGLERARAQGIKSGRPSKEQKVISKVISLSEQNFSNRQIAKMLSISHSTVNKYLSQHKPKPEPGEAHGLPTPE